jgi:hypothetical protein
MGSKIYFGGGRQSNTILNTFYSYSSSGNWIQKANMNLPRAGHRSLAYKNRIWIIGGGSINDILNSVEIYNPDTNSWTNGPSLVTSRSGFSCWIWDNKIFVAGGFNENGIIQSIEYFDSEKGYWQNYDTLPTPNKYSSATSLNDKIYIFGGVTETDSTGTNTYSNKLYAADLNASVDGVYDLYRKDGNASAGTPLVQAEVADGSVTASKIASKTIGKDQISDEILKYLKPEITSQPQANAVYADSNFSLSVTAEGKFLTYQWAKDGSNLAGETNSILTITDANATQHDGNYSVVVSNDFGSTETNAFEFSVINQNAISQGLVAWYPFDGNASDMSGDGNHGTVNGATLGADRHGVGSKAYNFDGVNDWIDFNTVSFGGTLERQNDYSISFWLKLAYSNNWGRVFNNYSNSNPCFIIGSVGSGSHNFFVRDTSGIYEVIGFGDKVDDMNWQHLAVQKNGNVFSSFLNSEFFESKTFSGSDYINSETFKLAKTPHGGDFIFVNCSIDDVRIYDRALSAAEVQALYNMG